MSDNKIQLNLKHTYADNVGELASFIIPTKLPNPEWVITSNEVAELLELPDSVFSNSEYLNWFSGNSSLANAKPLAQKYTGHQFGHYNPDLGDGRGLLLGELQISTNRWDLHVKGAGQTPYSRSGDGRAVLRSSIREFLASEALHHLNIPTSRALGVFKTSEGIQRETLEQGAGLIRICRSHLRFGHFEYAFYQNDTELFESLVDYTYSDVLQLGSLKSESLTIQDKALAVFENVVKSTALLIAKWQAFGFCHGVMNTDNMSILGITFDFGPYGFLDDFDSKHVCNHSDYNGRYAFDEQPGVGLWNLKALGHAFSSLLSKDQLVECLAQYEPILVNEYSGLMRHKLGLSKNDKGDQVLLGEWLGLLQKDKRDYTNSWRLLSNYDGSNDASIIDHFIDRAAASKWLEKYKHRLLLEKDDTQVRMQKMKAVNPKYILRNYLAQQAIKAAEAGDNAELESLFEVLKQPFDEQPEFEQYAQTPPNWGKELSISCSS
ncbi:protein adenylyltransferase SelO [uncultured Psychrosphaera sp.]|uniref:protein adenylyltransferase SelO n=1 Tax=uncultured Psychrosphaera sp. TaxID=1403522 RepID=UPI0026177158|nr:YdiU family protein [uncultured Psychrosphaera sp.]